MEICAQFRVFWWKNLLYVKFNRLALGIIFLGCFAVICVYLKSTYKLIISPEFVYEPKPFSVLQENFPLNHDDHLYYAPDTSIVEKFMESVRLELQFSAEAIKPLPDANTMKMILEKNCRGNCFAIHFENFPNQSSPENHLRYFISSAATRISPKKRYVNDEDINDVKGDDDYVRTGVFTLQHIIDKLYVQHINPHASDVDLEISSLPAIYQEAVDGQRLVMFGSIYSVLFNVLLLSTFLVPLVEEKQNGLKEFLIIATPLNFLNGVTFFLVRLILYLIFLVAVLIVGYIYQALGISPLIYISVLFVLYTLAVMSYTYLVSAFFNSVFYSKVGGMLLLIIPYIFYIARGSFSVIATFLFSTKALLEGLEILQIFTNKYRRFSATDLFYTNITESSFKLLSIYAILLGQILFYTLLYNYLASVFNGPGGLKKPYLFFLKSSFFKKNHRNQYTTSPNGDYAIIIQDLVKNFKTPARIITIADHLNMDIKNRQITVLLGHNGAGKTTTLNMIMGTEPKDSGKILVCSEKDVASYRHLIGFCPQYSVFIDYMSCQQHLQFFAQLRGVNNQQSKLLANNILEQLHLSAKANEFGKNLSGGMKRRLSLGIALSGDTKVVILDEPSSGLDIESRRELWDILLELRKSKAILITTHHMEEAEILGDTICILSNGRLQRSGSPLELKRKLNCGYILKLRTNKNSFKEQEVLTLIQQHIPEAKALNVVPPTVHINLPYAYRMYFSKMLESLEKCYKECGIESISITDTSLDDVFLKCSEEIDQIDSVNFECNKPSRIPYQYLNNVNHASRFQQCKAIFFKKFIFLRSEWIFTCIMIFLPILCTILATLALRLMTLVESEDVLLLNLNHIKNGTIYIYSGENANIERLLTEEITNYGINVKSFKNHHNTSDVSNEMVRLQKENLADFLQNVIGVIAVEPESNEQLKFSIFYSSNIYHSSVILLNLVDSITLQLATKQDGRIKAYYAPIKRFITDISPSRLEYYAVIMPIGLFFYMIFYVMLPFKEHQSGFKSLETIPRYVYWFFVLLFDMLFHSVMCIVLYTVQVLIISDGIYSAFEQSIIFSSILFYGFSYLPILYIFASSFRSISTISTYLLFGFIVSEITPLITSGNLAAIQYHETKIAFFSLLPDFNLNHQLRIINENFMIYRNTLSTQEPLSVSSFYGFAAITFILSMFLFLWIVEDKYKRQTLSQLLACNNCGKGSTTGPEEQNFVQQKEFVDNILKENSQSNYPLLVSEIYKFYGRRAAVRGLYFAVKKGECFGLLGVNGSGKTSTFQMITANTAITSGTIKIEGFDILENETAFMERFGYCPQQDCLNSYMTAFEILKYMAMIRGLQNSDIDEEVRYWLEKLDLERYENVQIRHYSGGTKRKLNAAMAMIGSPSLILLDEPTTGVDPVSRRCLWTCIQDFQKRHKTIVLTSHSMDECEQLCNRLAIMADGKIKCVGFIQDLKIQYGSGFTIKFKMHTMENVNHIDEEMKTHFPGCELREIHASMVTYFIKNTINLKWSEVFIRTEDLLNTFIEYIDDYSVNESTLEDIFLKCNSKLIDICEDFEEV